MALSPVSVLNYARALGQIVRRFKWRSVFLICEDVVPVGVKMIMQTFLTELKSFPDIQADVVHFHSSKGRVDFGPILAAFRRVSRGE